MVIRHRQFKAKIYGKSDGYDFYRLAYYTAGKRHVRSFAKYGEAKKEAERILRDLADGSQAAALTGPQSRDAIAALQRLEEHRQATGKRVSLLEVVSEYIGVLSKIPAGHTMEEVVDGFKRSVATVQRRDIHEAIEEFIQARAPLSKSTNGQRAQVSGKYAYNRELQLHRIAAAFPGTAVCDLTKEHLETFMGSLGEFSAKSRNHYRAAIRQFLQWAVRKDYLPVTHRLNEADQMRPERANTSEVAFYTPIELASLLEKAQGAMQPLIAIGGLAGLRTAELLRLEWADVWRVRGHIEISAGKSKTRSRRLVEICPALAKWLQSFRNSEGQLWTLHEITFQEQFRDLCELAKVKRKPNGLRHSFCTYHFAAHANENLTAAQAGNSPAMIHGHYKGLATKKDAQKWFAVKPKRAS
ncbi:MAG TPA: site-specific integrase [Verrucomicrobiae bacterium]|nr:site-specific integrase [Verrucomicrobiae bacterium]